MAKRRWATAMQRAMRLENEQRIRVGDRVVVRREWRKDPNRVRGGLVVRVGKWGRDGAVYVEGSPRAFAAYVFRRVKR